MAVPVAPHGTQDRISTAADEFICVLSPSDFLSVGQYDRNFDQLWGRCPRPSEPPGSEPVPAG